MAQDRFHWQDTVNKAMEPSGSNRGGEILESWTNNFWRNPLLHGVTVLVDGDDNDDEDDDMIIDSQEVPSVPHLDSVGSSYTNLIILRLMYTEFRIFNTQFWNLLRGRTWKNTKYFPSDTEWWLVANCMLAFNCSKAQTQVVCFPWLSIR
jgi:hypothetical protein